MSQGPENPHTSSGEDNGHLTLTLILPGVFLGDLFQTASTVPAQGPTCSRSRGDKPRARQKRVASVVSLTRHVYLLQRGAQ